jgi:ubiquinol-cytochrome c reductase iron-sulfur subunit
VSGKTSGNGGPPATLDDPHLRPAAKNPKRMEALAALAMLIGMAGFVAFIAAYWVNASNYWEAGTLGIGMLGLGVGVIAWGKYLMPQGPFVEERHDFHSTDDEREAFNAAITGRGGLEVTRRKTLLGIFALGGGIMTLALMIPGVRSLGPKPTKSEDLQGPTEF